MSRVELLATLDADPGMILAAAEEVLARLPDHAASHATRAGALIKLGRTEEALAAGWQAVSISPDDPTIHFGHGLVADDADDPPRAVGAYMCAVALSHSNESPYSRAAFQLNTSGLPTSTIWLLTGPLRPATMSAQLFFDLGQAYLSNMQFERALEAFDQAEAVEPLLHVALARSALLRLFGRTQEMEEALGVARARQFAVAADKLGASARLRLAAQTLVFLEDMPAADRLQFAAEVSAEIEDLIAAHAASGDLKGAITLLGSAKFAVIRRQRDRILPLDAIAEALVQIEKTPHGEALVYLLSGAEHAGAVMVTPAGWRWLSLPGLAEPKVRNARGALLQAYAAGEGRRFIAMPQAQAPHSNDDFAEAVVTCSRWLWTAGLGDLAEALIADGVERCSLVTSARLSMFPLAAAQDENGRYLIERLVLSQETSAGHWIEARTAAAHGVRRYAIAVPLATGRDALPWARAEALDLARRLPEPLTEVMDGGRATAAAFIRAFEEPDLVYYAGRAQANLTNPLDAILTLDGEPLRLADLVAHEMATPPRVIILSGCETGLLGPHTPAHEPLSFAALFALLGVPGVLAAHWALEDHPTHLIMRAFQDAFLGDSADAAVALASAQRRAISREFDTHGLTSGRPSSHPACWGALHVLGR